MSSLFLPSILAWGEAFHLGVNGRVDEILLRLLVRVREDLYEG